MNKISSCIILLLIISLPSNIFAQAQNRIYIANDDHTDYMWTANEATYRSAFTSMTDYYLNLANSTAGNTSPYQSRFNLDGSMWMWFYQLDRPARFDELINRIKDGHISVAMNGLVSVYGGQSTESVIRNMYYPGKIERTYSLRLPLALAMENATLPYGLGALWAGSGVKYTWKGICCSVVPDLENRKYEIYWWTGQDNSKILTKWNSFLAGNQGIGGYAEARRPAEAVDFMMNDPAFLSKYTYKVKGAFGKGWDDLKTQTNEFITAAQQTTAQYPNTQVYVSNEVDFFQDFENTYGSSLPTQSVSFGNEWDLFTGQLQEVSSRVKRAVEQLRSAEAMETLVSLKNPSFSQQFNASRDEAYFNLGLFWEHCGTLGGNIGDSARLTWLKKMASTFVTFSNTKYTQSLSSLSTLIAKTGSSPRFFVFNQLGHTRTDIADYQYAPTGTYHVIDLSTSAEVPSQTVQLNGKQYIRILAAGVPPIGYKVYEIRTGTGNGFSSTISASGSTLENSFYKLTLSSRGSITSLLDKTRSNKEFVQSFNGYTINDMNTSATGTLTVENAGPVSATIRSDSSSPLNKTSRITVYRDINRIDIDNTINQNFTNTLAWSFGFALNNPETNHEEVGAVVKAKLSSNGGVYSVQNTIYEWLTLNHFADQTGTDGTGITLSNRDLDFFKLGNSTSGFLDTTIPRISILAGGDAGSGYPGTGQAGENNFLQRFSLKTHGAYSQTDAMKMAIEHQNPLVTGSVQGGTAYPETSYSLLSVSSPDTFVWAVKPHEDGIASGVVVRLWNQSASSKNTSIQFTDRNISSAFHVSHIETDNASQSFSGSSSSLALSANQIKTYRFVTSQGPTPTAAPASSPTPTGAAKPGDANGDGLVDGRDFVIWATHYNQSVSGASNGDFDGNGIVDGRDFVIWATNYGT